VSIVGYDDVRMAALPHIDLTTVGQDARHTAQYAVERAVARLDRNHAAGHDVLVRPYFVVRGITGPAAAASQEAHSRRVCLTAVRRRP
jgi:LacI family transcriptional regulator